MTLPKTLMAAMTALALTHGASLVAAHAQDAPPVPTEAPTTQQSADTSDEKLKSFAVAFLEVNKINQSYQPRMEAATTEEDKERIRLQAGQEMISAVNGTEGISVEEYDSIIQAAQVDPELARRINSHINETAVEQSDDPAPAPAE